MQTYILVAFVSGYLWVSEEIAYGRICVFTWAKACVLNQVNMWEWETVDK